MHSQIMNIILFTFLHFYAFNHFCWMEEITSSVTESTTEATVGKTGSEEEEKEEMGEIEAVPTTEQIMDPNIKITNVPDVDEVTEDWDANWDKNKVIRDIAYYIRAHKFHDYDRRYYKRPEDSWSKLYQEFPKPHLRSLHWEVRRHCETSFDECLRYLEGIVTLTALKREDDTVTIMKEQKWNFENNTQQIQAAQRDCQTAQRRDNQTMIPFQGPIERFQWRTTVSYYMCWYTMLGVPELSIFGEPCDNHADCQVKSEGGNQDPRADDTKLYACALYSFCPDHCCPMKHIQDMTDCYQSQHNPCYDGNQPEHRECKLDRQQNHDFFSLVANQINITCECRESGYEWSSRFGLCIDVNECSGGGHGCSTEEGEVCMNLPGSYECVCKFGYVYDAAQKECILSPDVKKMLEGEKDEPNKTETKSLIDTIVKAIAKSSSNCLVISETMLFAAIFSFSFLVSKLQQPNATIVEHFPNNINIHNNIVLYRFELNS